MGARISYLTIHESAVALWRELPDGSFVRVAMDEKMERIVMSGDFAARPLQYQGSDKVGEYHEDETYVVEMVMPLALARGSSGVNAHWPVLTRNVRYAMAIVWKDVHANVWWKRIYRGVHVAPARTEADGGGGPRAVLMNSLRLRAESMEDTFGSGAKPSLAVAVRSGIVKYRSATATLDIYSWDGESGDFTLLGEDLTDYVNIDLSTPDEVSVSLDGDVVMQMDASGLSAPGYVATGGTFAADVPAIEFWLGDRRMASVTATAFYAPALTNTATSDDAIIFANTDPLLKLTAPAAWAPGFGNL